VYAGGRVQHLGLLGVDAAQHEGRVAPRLEVDQVTVVPVHLDVLVGRRQEFMNQS